MGNEGVAGEGKNNWTIKVKHKVGVTTVGPKKSPGVGTILPCSGHLHFGTFLLVRNQLILSLY